MVTGRVPKQNIKTTNPNKQIQRTQPGGHDDMFVKRAPNGTPTLPAGPPTNLQASTEEDRCGQMQRDIARKPSPSSCSRSPQPVKYVNLNRERFSAVFARRPAATERPPSQRSRRDHQLLWAPLPPSLPRVGQRRQVIKEPRPPFLPTHYSARDVPEQPPSDARIRTKETRRALMSKGQNRGLS